MIRLKTFAHLMQGDQTRGCQHASLTHTATQHFAYAASFRNEGFAADNHRANLRRIKLLYSNVDVVDDEATIDVVINVPKNLVGKLGLEEMEEEMIERAKSIYGIDKVHFNITVIPTQILRYNV